MIIFKPLKWDFGIFHMDFEIWLNMYFSILLLMWTKIYLNIISMYFNVMYLWQWSWNLVKGYLLLDLKKNILITSTQRQNAKPSTCIDKISKTNTQKWFVLMHKENPTLYTAATI